MSALFAGVALMNTAMAALGATSTLVMADTVGATWSGVPSAAAIAGTALGALGLGVVMARRGRRSGLLLGYGLAAPGAILAAVAVTAGSIGLLFTGMALLGVGNGAAQLARYAAADLYPRARKGFAVSLVVWGGTVGALVGPGLIAPSASAAAALRLPALAGPFLVMIAMLFAALLVSLPVGLRHGRPPSASRANGAPGIAGLVARRGPAVALVAMIAAQVDMVAVMTMAPLYMREHQHGLAAIGGVLSLHIVGMFALSPLSGRLVDRLGPVVAIVLGLCVLELASGLVVATPLWGGATLPVALFLLGYGWNLGFVGGSALLTRSLPADDHARLEGAGDALVWGSSAVASVLSGVVFAGGGYSVLAVAGGLAPAAALAVLVFVRANRANPDRQHPAPAAPEPLADRG